MTAIASRSRAESARHPRPPKPYNRSQMQPALPSPMPDASPAVFAVNDRKPHQGVAGKNPGLHQRFAACNSTTALGVSWGLSAGTVPGARVTYDYDAFGNQITHTGTTPNNYLYRGEQFDPDLGLYYLRARYYNPQTGRFMSRDPEDGQPSDPRSLQKYLYATGDPVDYSDPTGRDYVGTVAIDRRIDLETIPAQIALAAAISCAFELDASYLEAVLQGGPIEKSIFPCAVEAHGTCKSKFPKLVPVNDLPGWYEFDNQYYAFETLQEEWQPRVLRQGTNAPAESGPCAIGGSYTPGWHVNVLFAKGGGSAGSLVGCPCCDDSSGVPQPTERWGVIVNNPQ